MGAKGRRLPLFRREEFKQPFGKPITEDVLQYIDAQKLLITVGDVVSLTVRNHGIVQDLAIYDGSTERRTMTEFADLVRRTGETEETAENPAGTVTCLLFKAIENALNGKTKLIRVVGEEDLAVLPCMILAPDGTNIIYGDPGKGMRMITTSSATKEKAEGLWNQMEEFE